MDSRLKFKGKILTHLVLPVFFGIFLFIIGLYIISLITVPGLVISIASIIYIGFVLIMYFINKPIVIQDLLKFAVDYAQVQKELLQDLSIPYGLIDINGSILWENRELTKILKGVSKGQNIFSVIDDLPMDCLKLEDKPKNIDILLMDRYYKVQLKKISSRVIFGTNSVLDVHDNGGYLIAVYFFDETQMKKLVKENYDNKLVAGLIYIDNYEEALQSIEEVKGSLLTALIDRRINKFITAVEGIVKKIEKDKYFVIFKRKYLESLQADKFSIIDDIKNVNVGNDMDVTISIGFGLNGDTYGHNFEYSRTAMDLALGRGGDQAVIKDGEKIYYYGGKSRQVEKNTRVKARVKAHALREVLEAKDSVLVMGHKIGDIDSFGASIGIYRAAKSLGKKVHIVIDEINKSLRPMVENFTSNTDYDEGLFVKPDEAITLVDNNTVVVVVDVNRPSYTECPQLLKLCKSIVVLDHHRQTSEILENAVLSYIEPYASSTCEMVAEILQYIQDGIKIKQIEADAMYGGIMIDTNNFSQKAGVRTFEAAAFLRRNGADVTKIKMMFRNDITDYKARAVAVTMAEVFHENFAISECPSHNIESPTVVCAQAANELLNIKGIDASFVLTDYNGKIYVSARSMEDINVQLIMERIGGGGHLNVAGAQLENLNMDEAKQLVKDTLLEMIAEKSI